MLDPIQAWQPFTLIAETSDAYETGRWVGRIVLPLLMLAGAIKCFKIASREMTSGLCVLSLAVVLLVWGFSSVVNLMTGSFEDPTIKLTVSVIIGVIVLVGIIISLVLAIVGLSLYHARLVQGRKQAVTALVMNGLLLMLLIAGFAQGVAAVDNTPPGIAKEAKDQPAVGQAVRFEELNFQAQKPHQRWTQIKASVVNEDAAVVFRHTFPEFYWMVIAENEGIGETIDTEALVQIAESNLRGASENVSVNEVTPITVGGLPGLHMTADATIHSQQFSYDFRILSHNGFAYQLITFCDRSDRRKLEEAATELAAGFSLIDDNLVAEDTEVTLGPPINRLALPQAGLDIELTGPDWREWTEYQSAVPSASRGAVFSYNCYLAVIALPLDGIDVTGRELFSALLEPVGYTLDDPTFTGRQAVRIGDADGYRFTSAYESDDGPAQGHIYALRNKDWGYLINAFTLEQNASLLDQVDTTIQRTAIVSSPPEPLPQAAESHAEIYNTIGLSAYDNSDYTRAVAAFTKASVLNPAYETYANNVIESYEQLGQTEQAIVFAKHHLETHADHLRVRANLAYQLTYDESRVDEAVEHYKHCFEAGYESDTYLQDYANALRRLERPRQALAVIDEHAVNPSDVSLTIERCNVLSYLGEHDQAIDLLKRRCNEALPNPRLLSEWVRAHLRAGRTHEATELASRLTDQYSDEPEVWYIRGVAEKDLSWYPQARNSLERAIELRDAASYRELLEFVQSQLGQGDNALARTEITPVTIPEQLITPSLSRHPKADRHAAWIHHDIHAYQFEENQNFRKTRYMKLQITGPDALEDWSTLQFAFDSQYERIYVNELTVHDARGNVVARGDLDSFFVVDEGQDGIHSNDKLLNIPVPGLGIGHTLTYVVSYETLGKPDVFPFQRHHFVRTAPTSRMAVFVRADVDQFRAAATDGLREQTADTGRFWVVEPAPLYKYEKLMPDPEELFPLLSLGPANQTWQGLSTEYLTDLDQFLASGTAFTAEAKTIIGDAKNAREVVARTTRHVQTLLTYEAIAFGVRGRIPHTLSQITKQRFGDCKDHSLLLYHLLRSGGVKAHLALVHTQNQLVEELPSLNQFDHMVVYVPDINDGLVIDATDKSHRALDGTPIGVNGTTILVLDADNPRLIKPTPTQANRYHTKRSIRITADGDAVVKEVTTARGPWGEGLREFYWGKTGDDMLASTQSSWNAPNGLRLTSLTTSDLRDLDTPLQITCEYTVPDAFSNQGESWFGRLPAPWEVYYLTPDFLPKRHNDFYRESTFRFTSEINVEFPESLSLHQQPANTKRSAESLMTRITYNKTAKGLRLESDLHLHAGRYPAAQYAQYESDLKASLQALRPMLKLTKP